MITFFKNYTILLLLSIISCTNDEKIKNSKEILKIKQEKVKKCCENINSKTNYILNKKNTEKSLTKNQRLKDHKILDIIFIQ